MNKENIIIVLTSILLVSISIYNYIVYNEIDDAKKDYKDVNIFHENCNIDSQTITIGMWSNLLTMILSIFLLTVSICIIFNKKNN